MVRSLAQFTDVRTALAVGGLSLQAQASDLRTKPEVIVATPVGIFFFHFFRRPFEILMQRRLPAVPKFSRRPNLSSPFSRSLGGGGPAGVAFFSSKKNY